ncbi:hypothetical protein GN157_15575 [Flavobacterium rakeshii]|uniref:Carboxypeptidase-like regulatory domain-containing protein n=1 Tax=Flavobacterium rakeshii TaxID=1038845 RepID=A0A6N8HHB1_9FLAO|nr:hypothetical protein [Flavobacterium rakeshii]MUV05134.1 hypothetical protein [Flavobacterium rakeshii]
MKRIIFLFTLVITALPAISQEAEIKQLKGKIKSTADDLEGIYVVNKTSGAYVTTARGGYFSLMVKPKDTLIFSAIQIVGREYEVQQENIDSELFIIELEAMVTELDELVIENYGNITSESLGLVPKGQKRNTPAERKLYTASNGLDGFINALNGKKKALLKAVEYEKKEQLMAKINYIYTEEEIVKEFKVPKDYVGGFIYYAVEDKNFAKTIREKDDVHAKFLMTQLAIRYVSLLKQDGVVDENGALIELDTLQQTKPNTNIEKDEN